FAICAFIKLQQLPHLVVWAFKNNKYRDLRKFLEVNSYCTALREETQQKTMMMFLELRMRESEEGGVRRWAKRVLLEFKCTCGICRWLRDEDGLTDPTKCLICTTKERNAVLSGCGCVGICHGCASMLLMLDKKCPTCRTPFTSIKKLFYQ
uniref:RING-type domain-containing protein n=1 Tax=Clytia hemisphaerica TaxID=252671 RepID=A0A7M5WWV2_9CNID